MSGISARAAQAKPILIISSVKNTPQKMYIYAQIIPIQVVQAVVLTSILIILLAYLFSTSSVVISLFNSFLLFLMYTPDNNSMHGMLMFMRYGLLFTYVPFIHPKKYIRLWLKTANGTQTLLNSFYAVLIQSCIITKI